MLSCLSYPIAVSVAINKIKENWSFCISCLIELFIFPCLKFENSPELSNTVNDLSRSCKFKEFRFSFSELEKHQKSLADCQSQFLHLKESVRAKEKEANEKQKESRAAGAKLDKALNNMKLAKGKMDEKMKEDTEIRVGYNRIDKSIGTWFYNVKLSCCKMMQ